MPGPSARRWHPRLLFYRELVHLRAPCHLPEAAAQGRVGHLVLHRRNRLSTRRPRAGRCRSCCDTPAQGIGAELAPVTLHAAVANRVDELLRCPRAEPVSLSGVRSSPCS